jgi:hypothetical protein
MSSRSDGLKKLAVIFLSLMAAKAVGRFYLFPSNRSQNKPCLSITAKAGTGFHYFVLPVPALIKKGSETFTLPMPV